MQSALCWNRNVHISCSSGLLMDADSRHDFSCLLAFWQVDCKREILFQSKATSLKIEREYLHFPDFGSFDEASKLATSNAEALIYSSANGVPPTLVCKGMCIQLTWKNCVWRKPNSRGSISGDDKCLCWRPLVTFCCWQEVPAERWSLPPQCNFAFKCQRSCACVEKFDCLLAPQEEKGLILWGKTEWMTEKNIKKCVNKEQPIFLDVSKRGLNSTTDFYLSEYLLNVMAKWDRC